MENCRCPGCDRPLDGKYVVLVYDKKDSSAEPRAVHAWGEGRPPLAAAQNQAPETCLIKYTLRSGQPQLVTQKQVVPLTRFERLVRDYYSK